jgi:DNA-binding transcriptional LysR family regulator
VTLEQLRHFHETARRAHVGQAASALRISPSAIIYSIRRLESELGSKLFIKKGKRIFLSAKGEALLERLPNLFSCLEDLIEGMSSETSSYKGSISLAGIPMLLERHVVPELAALQKKHPQLQAEVLSKRSSDVMNLLQNGQVDLGFCLSPLPNPDVETLLLFQGQMRIYFRKSHPLTKVKKFQFSLLEKFPCILPKAQAGVDICERNPVFDKFQIVPQSKMAFDSYSVAIEHLQHSDSWSLLPDFFSHHLAAAPLPKNWDAPFRVVAAWNKSKGLNTKGALLVEALQKKLSPSG